MLDFPALYDVSRRTIYPLREKVSFTVGRSTAADLPVTDVHCAAMQFCIHRVGSQYQVEPLSTTSPTYCNEHALQGRTWLVHGAVLKAGSRQFRFLERVEEVGGDAAVVAARPAVAGVPPPLPVTRSAARAATVLVKGDAENTPPPAVPAAIPLTGAMLIGREAIRAGIHLDHPHVSRVHALIEREGSRRSAPPSYAPAC